MTTAYHHDPCCCDASITEESASQFTPMVISSTSAANGGMEIGIIHIDGGDEVPPVLILILFAAFLIFLIRSRRNEPFLTFGTILAGIDHRSSRMQRAPFLRSIRSFLSPLRLHALQSRIRCAYCHDPIAVFSELSCCPDCRTLHHLDCFNERGCAIYGCLSKQRPGDRL